MRNITFSAEEGLIEAARRRAAEEQTTLNAQFQRWLADYGNDSRPTLAGVASKPTETSNYVLDLRRSYESRIESLRIDAELDGFSVNAASENDFWSFIESVPCAPKAEVILVDNGNLRAVWDGDDGSHLGLQFLGSRSLQFVIFRKRKASSQVSRVAGNDTFACRRTGNSSRILRTADWPAYLRATRRMPR
jgi:ribosomal protein L44E